jgi:hypothetical protein
LQDIAVVSGRPCANAPELMMMLMKLTAAHISFMCFINISMDQAGHKVTQSDHGCCEVLHTYAPFVNLRMTATHEATPRHPGCHWEGYRLEQLKGWLDKLVMD